MHSPQADRDRGRSEATPGESHKLALRIESADCSGNRVRCLRRCCGQVVKRSVRLHMLQPAPEFFHNLRYNLNLLRNEIVDFRQRHRHHVASKIYAINIARMGANCEVQRQRAGNHVADTIRVARMSATCHIDR